MRLRPSNRTALAAALVATVIGASPSLAQEYDRYDADRPSWRHDDYPGRDEWLADCRARVARRDDGVGGAVIGGVVGGIAGNRVAGRGNRTAGTIAGAAVGAVAGAAIDRAEDAGRRDECEVYLDNYYASYERYGRDPGYPGYGYGYGSYGAYGYPGGGYPGYGPGYGYASYGYGAGCCGGVPMMMVPVQRSEPECVETVEYVYEDVPAPRPKVRYVPEKRTKIVPDKRVKITPVK
ncbi:hypothetical protein B2G71_13345 [Novosphingobium sp. PC22D]|uniref:glycine zipper 2TM domain-containing protein n=1 Tax=Novosphingobium sp. PC22D TaxID=1962403 RepID=UPI000BEF2591|nr:glycine zipper 2TM domain-containing protein [Novosphingobium sp. PC22D]PEQ12123.1 hypothetical protein B2G71_13345 [Novosphingobium sp. PC22D]